MILLVNTKPPITGGFVISAIKNIHNFALWAKFSLPKAISHRRCFTNSAGIYFVAMRF